MKRTVVDGASVSPVSRVSESPKATLAETCHFVEASNPLFFFFG
jgi:hypothetical protein